MFWFEYDLSVWQARLQAILPSFFGLRQAALQENLENSKQSKKVLEKIDDFCFGKLDQTWVI